MSTMASPTRIRQGFVVLFCTISVCTLLFFVQPQNSDIWHKAAPESLTIQLQEQVEYFKPWDVRNWVNGPPTKFLHDNLKKDKKYITDWSSGGFNNQYMDFINMIYLGYMSDRIPVMPPFYPHDHVDSSAGTLPFGEVFNVSEFRRATGIPLLQWHDVKQISPEYNVTEEPLGCWSSWATGAFWDNKPAISPTTLVARLGVDASYTPVPIESRRLPVDSPYKDPYLLFWPLVRLIFSSPGNPPPTNPAPFPSQKGSTLPPEDQLSCFDSLYFIVSGDYKTYSEWDEPYSFPFRFIGKYLRFTDRLQNIARSYIARAFNFDGPLHELPPHISIHARRGDFKTICWVPLKDCLPSIAIFARRVKEIQEELRRDHGLDIPNGNVILTSDEKDPEFWADVRAEGWVSIDHSNTLNLYGEWYLPLIDMTIQSLGNGFVGTDRSTFTTVSRLRVEAWNRPGISRIVRWGTLGADDH